MKNLIPAFSQQPHAVTLRSLEAEREFRKGAIGAFAIAVAIHATVIASYFLFPANDAVKINPTIRGGAIVPVLPIDFSCGWKPKPPGNSSAKAGIPIPVPIVEVENEHEFASQGQIGSNGIVGEYGTGEGSDGDVVGNPGDGIISIGEDTPTELWTVEREPVLVRRVAPKYPEFLQRAEIEGRVVVKMWVDKEGKVREAHVQQSANEMFNDAALEAAKEFLFTPAYMNAGPVSVWVSVPFTFRLQ